MISDASEDDIRPDQGQERGEGKHIGINTNNGASDSTATDEEGGSLLNICSVRKGITMGKITISEWKLMTRCIVQTIKEKLHPFLQLYKPGKCSQRQWMRKGEVTMTKYFFLF